MPNQFPLPRSPFRGPAVRYRLPMRGTSSAIRTSSRRRSERLARAWKNWRRLNVTGCGGTQARFPRGIGGEESSPRCNQPASPWTERDGNRHQGVVRKRSRHTPLAGVADCFGEPPTAQTGELMRLSIDIPLFRKISAVLALTIGAVAWQSASAATVTSFRLGSCTSFGSGPFPSCFSNMPVTAAAQLDITPGTDVLVQFTGSAYGILTSRAYIDPGFGAGVAASFDFLTYPDSRRSFSVGASGPAFFYLTGPSPAPRNFYSGFGAMSSSYVMQYAEAEALGLIGTGVLYLKPTGGAGPCCLQSSPPPPLDFATYAAGFNGGTVTLSAVPVPAALVLIPAGILLMGVLGARSRQRTA